MRSWVNIIAIGKISLISATIARWIPCLAAGDAKGVTQSESESTMLIELQVIV